MASTTVSSTTLATPKKRFGLAKLNVTPAITKAKKPKEEKDTEVKVPQKRGPKPKKPVEEVKVAKQEPTKINKAAEPKPKKPVVVEKEKKQPAAKPKAAKKEKDTPAAPKKEKATKQKK